MSENSLDKCIYCGSYDTKIVEGTPPHSYKRVCFECEKASWVSKNDVATVDKSKTYLYLMKFFISLDDFFKPGQVKNGAETYQGWTWYKPGYSKTPEIRLKMITKSLEDYWCSKCDIIGTILFKSPMLQSKAISLETELLNITKKHLAFDIPKLAFKKTGKKNTIKYLKENVFTPDVIFGQSTSHDTEDVINMIESYEKESNNKFKWLDGVTEYRNRNAKPILLKAFEKLGLGAKG